MPEPVSVPSPPPGAPDGPDGADGADRGSPGAATDDAGAASTRAEDAGRSSVRHLLPAADAVAWFVAVIATAGLLEIATAETWASVVAASVTAALLQVAVGGVAGVYRSSFPSGSLPEARRLVAGALVVGVLGSMVPLTARGLLPGAVDWPTALTVVAFPVAALAMSATRNLLRSRAERRLRPGDDATPTIVYGAGALGQHLVRQMLSDPDSTYRPVALLDDDPARRSTRLAGLRVVGGRDALAGALRRFGAVTVVLAVPRADATFVRDVTARAERLGARVLVAPSVDEMLRGSRPVDLRDVSPEELVGRRAVDTDVEAVADYVRGRRVLVTGAGGSIGSELCRQLSRFAPAELIMLDRDETALQSVQVTLSGHGLLDSREVVLADIRDATALTAVFRARRPEVVFHAAALKHLPLLEQYPAEAWQTNVMGTLNVLEAARAVDVQTFVNISTDKAANPTSVLGRSKRLAERLTAGVAQSTGRRYLSVRFGNVLGSRGSMVPLFRDLIAQGRPVTVTHPDATRYFMTIPEACHLVIQAGAIGAPGEALILDMGQPVKVLDIADRLIALSGRDVDVVFTGLRPGEKLHEELNGSDEVDARPVHPLISHASVPPMDACSLDVRSLAGEPPTPPVHHLDAV
ncbi:polysaccharide biosynthesis protein [Frigoribacterium sp. VKM Ac-1396]|uniref:polysaccharide biosynthesis protein n=1 Tax=Frigoribacterium sp. VKM Ac-1396 TaxID=2783821 RepID=UPI00188C297F|nr:nucleoside-diphosphate sugar epimerase/dehydratase [Frigoribacterium sp. VKM Ac-1396]MBF4601670.1 polysaccharide biosynthesis protein [Frigoribacterium sp. VKM Ac-1396]